MLSTRFLISKFIYRVLEKLTAKIIVESGLGQQNSMGDAGWDRIKRFTAKYRGVSSEKLKVETYRQELRDAMQMLSVSVSLQERTSAH
jgi:hypothetical protein